jgi:3-oxoacyl-(acyl-carrier-protein) synthase
MLVLESLDSARARGATVLAEIVGAGYAGDGYHMTAPRPDGAGARLAMQAALADAGVCPVGVCAACMHMLTAMGTQACVLKMSTTLMHTQRRHRSATIAR